MSRGWYSLLAAGLCVAAAPVAAQSTSIALSRCTAITSPTRRLACYDGVARHLGHNNSHPDSSPAISGVGRWRLTQKISPIDDSKTVVLALDANEQIRGMLEVVRPTLIVRCKERKTEIYIAWNAYLGLEETDVLTRIDDEPARTDTWDLSTDNEATFRRRPIPFIKNLLGHHRLLARTIPYGEDPALVTFDLTGLDKAVTPLRQACGW